MRYRHSVARAVLGLVLVAWLSGGCAPVLREAGREPWAERAPLLLPTSTPAYRPRPERSRTPQPTRTPTPLPAPIDGPLVWIGGEGSLTMLGPEGWQTFPLQGIVRDIAIDARGNAILAPGLRMCDGRLLRELLPPAPGGEQDAVAVDPQGRIWVGYYGGVAVLVAGRWQTVPLDTGPASMVRDLAVDSQGTVWAATGAGLARYDGSAWRYYGEEDGLAGSLAECLMVDEEGRVWMGHEKGLSVLQGSRWQHFPLDTIGFVRGLLADREGRILAGSLYHGVSAFDGTSWFTYADRGSGLPSDRVTALAQDELGRIWVGTRYGLSVYDGERWRTYQECNSGLGDNQVLALAIGGQALAALPPLRPVRYGRFTGSVLSGREPVGGARVVLCPEISLAQGFEDTPCDSVSFGRVTRTAADGSYTFEWVPVGHYAVAAEVEPGRWVTRTRVLAAVRYQVREGETTMAETILGEE